MGALRNWWRQFLLLVFQRPAPPGDDLVIPVTTPKLSASPSISASPPPPPATPDIVPLLAMDIPPPPAEDSKQNRHTRRSLDAQRRKYERARMRHDKWVEPVGPQPIKEERDERPPKEAESEPEVEILERGEIIDDPNDHLIVDEWLQGDGEEVLYEEAEFYGEFNFRDTILDQLDRYWVYIERMKRHDPDAYGFYRQLGATLVPYMATGSYSDKPHDIEKIKNIDSYKNEIRLSPWFKQTWPAFGCCAFGVNPRDEAAEMVKLKSGYYQARPKFLYFRRVRDMPWTVQPVRGGKLYMLTVWWDRVEKCERIRYKWGRPQEFPVQISDDGERIKVLKTRRDGDGDKVRPWWDWQFPHEYKEWSKHYGLDAQTHLSHIFTDAVRDVERAAYSMLRVEVTKGDLTAVFGLSPHRTPYFFQDRDIQLTESGKKRRIFHMVRPFIDRKGVAHPMSFRGVRDFRWAGYDVHISVPGRDHLAPLEINIPLGGYRGRVSKDDIREPEVARIIKQKMHEGYK